ncbi:MAG: FAD:protein FMN transferase [Magnetococcales bacterium]|nr:FAD:protein FMN transferase [Magnetococcales bacterium]
MRPFCCWLCVMGLLVSGCSPPARDLEQTTTRLMMGTLVTITTFTTTAQPQQWQERERQAVAAAFTAMEQVEQMASRHRDDSDVTRVNNAPRGELVVIPDGLVQMVRTGLEMSHRSGGAFDQGLLPLIRLWGFSEPLAPTHPPDPTAIQRWLTQRQQSQQPAIQLLPDARLVLRDDSVGLDLGGLAKGSALNRALAVLQQQGIDHALVNIGGDIRAHGRHGNRPWRVAIQHPRREQHILTTVELGAGESIFTSGDYERFFIHEGQRYHHILDPATGFPARSGLISVSVWSRHDSSLPLDGWSTALLVLGAERGLEMLRSATGIEALLVNEQEEIIRTAGFPAIQR